MWKVLIVSVFLTGIQASEVQKIFGQWTQVAIFPVSTYVPSCFEFDFAGYGGSPCTCDDGKNMTEVAISLIQDGVAQVVETVPLVVVNDASEVAAHLRVKCTCESKQKTRGVIRIINEKYFVMYEELKDTNAGNAPNNAYIFAKKAPKHQDFLTTLQSIEDLKNRQGGEMCASDIRL